ncbi:MAG: exodeoxyribonuclease VII large subunit [Phycisphaerales bacterium]
MSRLPFDLNRAAGAAPVGPAAGSASALSVSAACDLIRRVLEDGVPSPLRVVGEVGGLSQRNHWYFSLKDAGAVLSCVAWQSAAAKFGFVPRDGEEVVAVGHVSHYAPQGRTQFYVTRLEQVGAGRLAARFRAMCDELRALGYFDEERKKSLPLLPRRIAVITSRSGAALQDVLDTARRRCKAVELLLVDVRVQGDGAAEQVARAIAFVDRHRRRLGIDAILVTRGGGSMEDLWTFNERVVADAVFACGVPVVAAIGHESDTTVIELVADVRAATPTQAAMRLVPDGSELRRQVDHQAERLRLVEERLLGRARQRLELAARHELLRGPQVVLGRHAQRTELLRRTLVAATRELIATWRRDLDRAAAALDRIRPSTAAAHARGEVALVRSRLRSAIAARLALGSARVAGLERQPGGRSAARAGARLHHHGAARRRAGAERARGGRGDDSRDPGRGWRLRVDGGEEHGPASGPFGAGRRR